MSVSTKNQSPGKLLRPGKRTKGTAIPGRDNGDRRTVPIRVFAGAGTKNQYLE